MEDYEPGKLYAKAIAFAAQKHGEQLRKGNSSPYILHPIRASDNLRVHLGFENKPLEQWAEEVCAAMVLHDVPEDCYATDPGIGLVVIEREFGSRVRDLVQALTKRKDLGQTRKDYIESFRTADPWACLMKLADRTDNVLEGGLDEAFTSRYIEETHDLLENMRQNSEFTMMVVTDSAFYHTAITISGALHKHIQHTMVHRHISGLMAKNLGLDRGLNKA